MLRDELLKRKAELETIIEKTKNRFRTGNEKIRCSSSNGMYQYYFKDSNSKNGGEYIPQENIQIARDIVQHEYNQKLYEMATQELRLLDKYLSMNENKFVDLYEKMHPARKALVKPLIISRERYAKKWQAVKYEGNNKWEMTTQFKTRRGDNVRSKSEMIIADTLYSLGIPYRYEYPITFKNGVTFYTDFTALNVRERKEYRIEHLGMLDIPEYCKNALRKIETYESNGIFLGRDLIITYDIDGRELNSNLIEMKARAYLL